MSLGKRYNNWLYRVRHHVFKNLIKNLNVDISSAEVLDIGSGTGFYIEEWMNYSAKTVTGTDLTSIAIKNLKKKFPSNEFFEIDIGKVLPDILQKKRYDIVSAFDILYHIIDDADYRIALENIYTLLKRGGLFIFSDNFIHSNPQKTLHQVSRSITEVEQSLENAGFNILSRIPMFVFMNYPVDSHHNIEKLLWQLAMFPVTKSELAGYIYGAVLFPIEVLSTRLFKESNTSEIMICKKK